MTDCFWFKLNNVLADIPCLAVGILAFCTFTFLALLKRLGMCALSSLIALGFTLTALVVCLQSYTCPSSRLLLLRPSTYLKCCNRNSPILSIRTPWVPLSHWLRRERLDMPSLTRSDSSSSGYSSRSHPKPSETPQTLVRALTAAIGVFGVLPA